MVKQTALEIQPDTNKTSHLEISVHVPARVHNESLILVLYEVGGLGQTLQIVDAHFEAIISYHCLETNLRWTIIWMQ